MASRAQHPDLPNVPANGVSYFTPSQDPIAGSVTSPPPNDSALPKLFTPLTIRGVTFQNRIFVCIPLLLKIDSFQWC